MGSWPADCGGGRLHQTIDPEIIRPATMAGNDDCKRIEQIAHR
jgi:hypothetical protein